MHPEMIMNIARQRSADRAERHARDRRGVRLANGDEPARRRRPRAGASREPGWPRRSPSPSGRWRSSGPARGR